MMLAGTLQPDAQGATIKDSSGNFNCSFTESGTITRNCTTLTLGAAIGVTLTIRSSTGVVVCPPTNVGHSVNIGFEDNPTNAEPQSSYTNPYVAISAMHR
jgi:hypothetical protein